MANPKIYRQDGIDMHYSVGALIEKNGKILLIDRVKPPFGFAGIAGHVDEGENELDALYREVREESGLTVLSYELVAEELIPWNECRRGIKGHYWYLYKCTTRGRIKRNVKETNLIKWYSRKDIKNLKLEPVWEHWFKKLGII